MSFTTDTLIHLPLSWTHNINSVNSDANFKTSCDAKSLMETSIQLRSSFLSSSSKEWKQIHTYVSPFNGLTKVTILFHEIHGLYAFVEKKKQVAFVPFIQPKNCESTPLLQSFLKHTFLVINKGGDGHMNSVAARVKGVGGVGEDQGIITLPSYQGYAIGSLIHIQDLMMQYYEQMTAVSKLEMDRVREAIENGEREIALIKEKIERLKNPDKEKTKRVSSRLSGQDKELLEKIKELQTKIDILADFQAQIKDLHKTEAKDLVKKLLNENKFVKEHLELHNADIKKTKDSIEAINKFRVDLEEAQSHLKKRLDPVDKLSADDKKSEENTHRAIENQRHHMAQIEKELVGLKITQERAERNKEEVQRNKSAQTAAQPYFASKRHWEENLPIDFSKSFIRADNRAFPSERMNHVYFSGESEGKGNILSKIKQLLGDLFPSEVEHSTIIPMDMTANLTQRIRGLVKEKFTVVLVGSFINLPRVRTMDPIVLRKNACSETLKRNAGEFRVITEAVLGGVFLGYGKVEARKASDEDSETHLMAKITQFSFISQGAIPIVDPNLPITNLLNVYANWKNALLKDETSGYPIALRAKRLKDILLENGFKNDEIGQPAAPIGKPFDASLLEGVPRNPNPGRDAFLSKTGAPASPINQEQ